MRTSILFSIGAALLAAALPAQAASPAATAKAEARLAKALDGRVAGKPVDCINLRNIQSSEIIDRTAILYRVGGKLYVNRPDMGKESLDSDDILVTKTYTSQLCSLDTVHLVDRASRFQSGFVGLGKFVPYTKVAASN
jgi:hypothetical protein